MEDAFRFKCPNPACAQRLKARYLQLGKRARCTRCNSSFIVTLPTYDSSDPVAETPAGRYSPPVPAGVTPAATTLTPEPGSDTLRLPILRVKSRLFRTEVVAMYETHLVKGTRYFRRARITEAMCHRKGEKALRQHLTLSTRIDFEDIVRIREKANPRPVRWLRSIENVLQPIGVSPVSLDCHFTIRSRTAWPLRFRVLASQVGHVRSVLSAERPDCYQIREARLLAPLFLLFCGLLILLGAALGLANGAIAAGLIMLCLACFYVAVGAGYLFPILRPWKPIDEYRSEDPTAAGRRRRFIHWLKRPLRSKFLGWALKAAGVAYWLFVATGISMASANGDSDQSSFSGMTSVLYIFRNSVLFAPAPLLIFLGSRLCQRQYDPRTKGDTRKPILYLRPFEDDAKTTLQPAGILAAVSGLRGWRPIGWSKTSQENDKLFLRDLLTLVYPVRLLRMFFDYDVGSSEECLVRFFETFGPVVAIGKPGETMATPGAARMYVDDNVWQDAILGEFRKAQAIVIQPGTSAGVRWELEQLRTHVEPQRILFCLVSFWRRPQAYEELARLVRMHFQVNLPRIVPYLDEPAFVLFDHDWTPRLQELSYKNPILWPLFSDATDLNYALQPFLQGMHGGEREDPRPPRWKEGLMTGCASILAIVVALFVFWAVSNAGMFVVRSAHALFDSSTPKPNPQRQVEPGRPGAADLPPPPTKTPVAMPATTPVATPATTTWTGRTLAYQLHLEPEWRQVEAGDGQDLAFKRDKLQLIVVAGKAPEDISTIGVEFAKSLQKVGEVTVTEDGKKAIVRGKNWFDWKFRIVAGKVNVRQFVRAYSGPEGTVLLIGVATDDNAEDDTAIYEAFAKVELPAQP